MVAERIVARPHVEADLQVGLSRRSPIRWRAATKPDRGSGFATWKIEPSAWTVGYVVASGDPSDLQIVSVAGCIDRHWQ